MSRPKSPSGTGTLAALGGGLVLFLSVPLIVLLASVSRPIFWQTTTDPEVMRSLRVTLTSAAWSVILGLLGGVPLAFLLARRHWPGKRMVESLLTLPIILPHTSAGVALLLTYGARGVAGRPLSQLGIFFTDRIAGIVLAMLYVSVPFLITTARVGFAAIPQEIIEAACMDGASAWQRWWHILLPLAKRPILSGSVMMWARGISEFGAIVLLAYHPRTLSVLIYERFQGYGLDAATPLAAWLLIVALLLLGMLALLSKHRE